MHTNSLATTQHGHTKRLSLVLVGVLFLLLSLFTLLPIQNLFAQESVGEANAIGWRSIGPESGGSCVNIEQPLRTSFYVDANPIYASAGQSFTVPTGANETFGITAHFGFIEADSTITLNLYNGPASGNIGTPIATATYTNSGPRVDAPIGSDLAIYFEFASPVSLTPGNEYYYLLSPSFDPVAFSYAFANGNPYTEGSALSGLSDGTVGSWSYDLKFTVHLCQEASNGAPVAEDDTTETNINTPVNINVLDNDSDPDNDPLNISAVGSAGNGTAVISNTQVTYTPATDFTGTDSFTYTISDGDLTDSATVTVTVTPVEVTCTQQDFLTAVAVGESSGTIELDGHCRYVLNSAADSWFGGSGAFLFRATQLNGNGATIERAATAPQFRLLAVQVDAGLTIRDLTFRNGDVSTSGGAIFATRPVTLENVHFVGNRADGLGGAVVAGQSLVVRNATFMDNQAIGKGGAIFAFNNATIENSRFETLILCKSSGFLPT